MNARETIVEMSARFGERAPQVAQGDDFVAENFAELRAAGMLAAAVPAELGGRGMEVPELAEMLKTMARVDLLQRNDVRFVPAHEIDNAMEIADAVRPDAAMNVPGQDADGWSAGGQARLLSLVASTCKPSDRASQVAIIAASRMSSDAVGWRRISTIWSPRNEITVRPGSSPKNVPTR